MGSFGFWAFTPDPSAQNQKQKKQNFILTINKAQRIFRK